MLHLFIIWGKIARIFCFNIRRFWILLYRLVELEKNQQHMNEWMNEIAQSCVAHSTFRMKKKETKKQILLEEIRYHQQWFLFSLRAHKFIWTNICTSNTLTHAHWEKCNPLESNTYGRVFLYSNLCVHVRDSCIWELNEQKISICILNLCILKLVGFSCTFSLSMLDLFFYSNYDCYSW